MPRPQSDVLARVPPLVGTTMAEHVGEVVVVEVHAIAITVKILKVVIAVHENLHWFAALFNKSDNEDATYRDPHHGCLHPHRQEVVKPALDPLAESHGVKPIL